MKLKQYKHHCGRQNVAVVGDILGLEPQYNRILEESDFNPRIYNNTNANIREKVACTDLIILFAGTVSHKMAREVRKAAAAYDIPLVTIMPSSLSALKKFVLRVR